MGFQHVVTIRPGGRPLLLRDEPSLLASSHAFGAGRDVWRRGLLGRRVPPARAGFRRARVPHALVHLDGVEHGCCGPSARRDAAETAAHRRDPLRDLRPHGRVRADGARGLRWRSTRPDGRPTHARGATVRSVRSVPASGRRARDRHGRERALRAAGRRRGGAVGGCSGAPIPRRTSPTCSTCSASARSPGRCSRSASSPRRRPARWPSGSASRSRPSPTRRSSASRRRATPAAYARANLPHLVRGGRGRRPGRRRARATRGPSRSRSGSAGGRASRRVSDGTWSTSNRRRTGSSSGRSSCSTAAGSSPTASRGSRAAAARRAVRGRGPDPLPRRRRACAVEPLGDARVRIEFRSPQRAVAPGQSAVLYRGDEVLGGGRIVEAIR